MLSWIFGPKKEHKQLADTIWLNQEQKWAGLQRLVAGSMAPAAAYLLLAHFPHTLQQAQSCLQGLPYFLAKSYHDLTAHLHHPAGGTTLLTLANELPEWAAGGETTAGATFTLHLIGLERYPVPHPDQQLVSWAKQAPYSTTISFWSALDDPLLRRFGGDSFTNMVENLGIQPETPLQNQLLGRVLEQAQHKVAQKISAELPADSAEAWFAHNLPLS